MAQDGQKQWFSVVPVTTNTVARLVRTWVTFACCMCFTITPVWRLLPLLHPRWVTSSLIHLVPCLASSFVVFSFHMYIVFSVVSMFRLCGLSWYCIATCPNHFSRVYLTVFTGPSRRSWTILFHILKREQVHEFYNRDYNYYCTINGILSTRKHFHLWFASTFLCAGRITKNVLCNTVIHINNISIALSYRCVSTSPVHEECLCSISINAQ